MVGNLNENILKILAEDTAAVFPKKGARYCTQRESCKKDRAGEEGRDTRSYLKLRTAKWYSVNWKFKAYM